MTKKNYDSQFDVPMTELYVNEVHRVYFRAGLLVFREYLARHIQQHYPAISPLIPEVIRQVWMEGLDTDPGPPRKLDFNEISIEEGEGYKENEDIPVNIEALPVALGILNNILEKCNN